MKEKIILFVLTVCASVACQQVDDGEDCLECCEDTESDTDTVVPDTDTACLYDSCSTGYDAVCLGPDILRFATNADHCTCLPDAQGQYELRRSFDQTRCTDGCAVNPAGPDICWEVYRESQWYQEGDEEMLDIAWENYPNESDIFW